MATYSKTTWSNGEAPAITAENLNNIENGIYNAYSTPGLLKGNANGTLSAAIAGIDYQSPITAGTGISIVNGIISVNFENANGVSF